MYLTFHSYRKLPKNIPPSIFVIPTTSSFSPQVCSEIMFTTCSRFHCSALPLLRKGLATIFSFVDNKAILREKPIKGKWLY